MAVLECVNELDRWLWRVVETGLNGNRVMRARNRKPIVVGVCLTQPQVSTAKRRLSSHLRQGCFARCRKLKKFALRFRQPPPICCRPNNYRSGKSSGNRIVATPTRSSVMSAVRNLAAARRFSAFPVFGSCHSPPRSLSDADLLCLPIISTGPIAAKSYLCVPSFAIRASIHYSVENLRQAQLTAVGLKPVRGG